MHKVYHKITSESEGGEMMTPKILIIDDEPDIIEFMKSYLSRRKYPVFTASITNQALELIKNESPDLVFCDMRLETDISGLNIVEQAKKLKPELIIYLVTGIIDREIEKEGLRLGAKEVLYKPIPNEEFEKKIKECFPN